MASTARAAVAAVAILAFAAAACSGPSVLPSLAASGADGASAAPSSGADELIPRILVRSPHGTFAIVDPGQPAVRRPLTLPPGFWELTVGPASVALSNQDPAAPRTILVGTVPDAAFVESDAIPLPGGEMWAGGDAACLSGAGLVLAADAGLSLWLVAPGEDPVRLPNQGNNRGGCVWLDDSRAVWDQEDGSLATFDLETGKTTQLPGADIVRNPSGGRGRIAGGTAARGITVDSYALDGPSLKIGPPIGGIGAEAGGTLSSDGRWLLTIGPDRVARVYRVDAAGLTKLGGIPLQPDERVDWMPQPGP